MKNDPTALLQDAILAAEAIENSMDGVDIADYRCNFEKQAAVKYQFVVIGEALNQLGRVAPELSQQIPELCDVVDFRNVLTNGYSSIAVDRVWEIAKSHLPQLLEKARELL